jgi:hypothetical protein
MAAFVNRSSKFVFEGCNIRYFSNFKYYPYLSLLGNAHKQDIEFIYENTIPYNIPDINYNIQLVTSSCAMYRYSIKLLVMCFINIFFSYHI